MQSEAFFQSEENERALFDLQMKMMNVMYKLEDMKENPL